MYVDPYLRVTTHVPFYPEIFIHIGNYDSIYKKSTGTLNHKKKKNEINVK